MAPESVNRSGRTFVWVGTVLRVVKDWSEPSPHKESGPLTVPRRARVLRRLASAVTLAAIALTALGAAPVSAVSLTPVASGLSSPVFVTHAGDSRLFIVEQTGRIRIRSGLSLLATPFFDISTRIRSSGEEGLLGLAFHPDYANSGAWGYRRFYVYYTNTAGDNVISEFQRSVSDPNRSYGTERKLLTIAHPTYSNHNGGMIAFRRADRLLYIATGDGGGGGDPFENAQNNRTHLGKILRIDPHPSGSQPFTVPSTNPFAGSVPGANEVWAYGLRNPWRFSFDRTTSDLWIGDVGQGAWEEVNRVTSATGLGRGANYGWDCYEANAVFESEGCSSAGKTWPIAWYTQAVAGEDNCAVTGGYVSRRSGSTVAGRYLFGDYCSGRIWSLPASTTSTQRQTLLLDTPHNISSFGEDVYGRLYLVSLGGEVFQISGT